MSTISSIDSSFGDDHPKNERESLVQNIWNPICHPDGCVIKIFTVKLGTNFVILYTDLPICVSWHRNIIFIIKIKKQETRHINHFDRTKSYIYLILISTMGSYFCDSAILTNFTGIYFCLFLILVKIQNFKTSQLISIIQASTGRCPEVAIGRYSVKKLFEKT